MSPEDGLERTNGTFRLCTPYRRINEFPLASIHLEGRAELLFQGLVEKGLPTWQLFVEEVYERFGGLDPGAILGEFNTLLRSAIKGPLISLRPTRLHQVVALAKNQENTINAILQLANPTAKSWNSNPKHFTSPRLTHNLTIPKTHRPPPKPFTKKTSPQTPIRRVLSKAEMRARRSKNLCYNCSKIFRPRHKCKQQFMYCLLTEEEAALEGISEEKPTLEASEEDMAISVNALNGNTDFNTFKVKEKVYGHDIQILIDGGSIHYFLDEATTSILGCALEQTTPMVVSVVDGRQMVSQWHCPIFT
ncbi:UNVERIFIED_CONTAM: hypothetical protein Sradi_0210800 [Sesamum radiatum]|uniref:Uncharacterized protein n=1 Tax=Sesamum radiatum TaxID=300843 RepID=A0AAW2W1B9_SESRA